MYPDLPFLHFPTSCPDFPSVGPNQKPYEREPKAIGDPEQSKVESESFGDWWRGIDRRRTITLGCCLVRSSPLKKKKKLSSLQCVGSGQIIPAGTS